MLRAIWMPQQFDNIEGLSRKKGDFWIGYSDDDERRGEIGIRIVVPADPQDTDPNRPTNGFFAAFTIHQDGIPIITELFERDFMDNFANKHANTFYDVMDCLFMADIPVMVQGNDDEEFLNRAMYEILVEGKS